MEEKENNVETEKEVSKKKKNKYEEELFKARSDMENWKNQYFKVYADMANLRKEIEKDHKEVIKYRIEGFVDKLIGTLDAFDMAFKMEPKTEEMNNYLTGFKYVYTSLLNILEEEGVSIINPPIDSKFSEETMHAVETIECEGEENLVKNVSLKGYKLYDHLIRPAMVIVSKKPEQKEESDETNSKNIA